jgi:hypothetical protein
VTIEEKKTLHRIDPKYTWDMFAACPFPSYSPLVAGTHKQKRREKTKMKKNKKGK